MNTLMQPLKKTVSGLFCRTFYKSRSDKNHFILYKIVDSYLLEDTEYYKVQCINTKALLHITIEEIVFDWDILYALHPVQGCFVGIEYAKVIKSNHSHKQCHTKSHSMVNKHSTCRYGNNILLYQDREGLLGFECTISGKKFLMDPRDIALSRELIEEFDVAQAFCIGVLAGLKLVNPVAKHRKLIIQKKVNYLRRVK